MHLLSLTCSCAPALQKNYRVWCAMCREAVMFSACNTVIVLEFDELRFIPFMASVSDCIFVCVNTTQVEFLGNNNVKMAEINTLKRGNEEAVQ